MHNQTFAFESDFVDTLRCIPMAVRLKLDVCRIKLSLRQWSRLEAASRRTLLDAPCGAPAEIDAYQALLLAHVAKGDPGQLLGLAAADEPVIPPPDCLPDQVRTFAAAQGLAPIAAERWAGLTGLQRFALVKLSRDNHDNVNFVPAAREFGVAA